MRFYDIHNILVNLFGYALSYVEFVGTLLGLFSVWFAARENILTWLTGLINVICLFAVFYQVLLYSDMFLQVYFFITCIYGWITWKNQAKIEKSVSFLSVKKE